MHVVGCYRHFLWVDEFAHDLFAGDVLAAAAIAAAHSQHLLVSVLRTLRVVADLRVLGACDDAILGVVCVLASTRFALAASQRLAGILGCLRVLAASVLFLLLDIVVVAGVAVEIVSVHNAARLILLLTVWLNVVASHALALDRDSILLHTCVSELRVDLFGSLHARRHTWRHYWRVRLLRSLFVEIQL